ncbi:MAG: hypothetical protein LBI43_07815 [Streptococcaceae bacterium]|jgi:hypothetical protein|nr:hypothetical protein [Streptococcaceae bacterium]
MRKLLKFGAGLAVGVAAGLVAYKVYQDSEDNLRHELVEAAREHFAGREIEAVWLFDKAVDAGLYEGGVLIKAEDGHTESTIFSVDEDHYGVVELESESLAENE